MAEEEGRTEGKQETPQQGTTTSAKAKPKKSPWRWLKWVGAAVAAPVGLFALAAALIYSPPVQNWAVKKVASYASEKTGMQISVDHVKLEFPLKLGVEGVKVIKPNDSIPQLRDTIADIGKVVADVKLLPLLKKKVEIDAFDIKDAKVNTTDFIPQARVKGKIGHLHVESHGVDLNEEGAMVDNIRLEDSNVDIALTDSTSNDTTESENKWKIKVKDLTVKNSDVSLRTPGDTLQVSSKIGELKAKDGEFDLGKGEYKMASVKVKDSKVNYDNNDAIHVEGLDYNHLELTDVNAQVDSVSYKSPDLRAAVKNCSFKEKSGMELKELSGDVSMNDSKLVVDNLHLKTGESAIDGKIDMDLNAFTSGEGIPPGALTADLNMEVGKKDLVTLAGKDNADLINKLPNKPIKVKGQVSGNMKEARFNDLNLRMPGNFDINATGTTKNLDDLDHLQADVDMCLKGYDLSFVKQMMDKDTRKRVNIPKNIRACGWVKANGKRYDADVTAYESKGTVAVKGHYNGYDDSYQAKVKTNGLNVSHFLPHDSIYTVTATADVKGKGFDVMSKSTNIDATADIKKLHYGSWHLDNMQAKANLKGGKAKADVTTNNSLAKGHFNIDADLSKDRLAATVKADLDKADLYKLNVMDRQMSVAAHGTLDIDSDLDEYYKVKGRLDDVAVHYDSSKVYRPGAVDLDIMTRRDTTHAYVNSGDFIADVSTRGGYKHLLNQFESIIDEAKAGYKARNIDEPKIRKMLPVGSLYLKSGTNNPFHSYVKSQGFDFQSLLVDMTTAPIEGINGDIKIGRLSNESLQIDTINLAVVSDSTDVWLKGFVQNYEDNPDYVFRATVDGHLLPSGGSLLAQCYDDKEKLILHLGADATLVEEGINLHLQPSKPVLGYKEFKVNDDNYVLLHRNRRVSAAVNLLADDGTGVQVYTNDENEDALQDITVSLHKFDLQKTLAVIPYLPKMEGVLSGDFHAIQTTDELTVSSDVNIKDFVYEGCQMGNMGAEFVYMPKDNDTHYVDGILSHDGQEVATVTGTYKNSKEGDLDAVLSLNRFPLEIVNGFIPDQLFGFRGYGDGDLTVKGTLSRPKVDGEVYLDSSYLVSVPYGVEMRFANDPVRIVGSKLLLENFEVYGYNDSPLNIAGNVDFSDLDRMTMDIRMRARNFLLINAKEKYNSVAYGKAYVNFFGRMHGPLDALTMRGKLDVLGETDLAYILKDSPLTTDNQLEGLVEFVDFSDTARVEVERPRPTGLDMLLNISVNTGAHVLCYLNSDHSNYLDLTGGGDLKMSYNAIDDLQLTGCYTLNSGEMKYSLPVIPLKTFTIQEGSYLEFTGDPMNPTLNITAEERTKATVSSDEGVSRSVTFDCGVKISKTLEDMGLEFIVSAPEDVTVQSELSAMSTEQRGKIAVTLLTTGMYLTDGNTSGFSMNSALNSFLQNEINNITGNALKSIDMSFGMESGTTSTGEDYTSYSFKFAKRFWNNRLNVIVGGRVATENDPQQSNNTFFDNVTLEYRLDQSSSKNLKVFYQKNAYDWLEGNLTKYGAGFVWRRKLQKFKDIFSFKNTDTQLPPPNDSIRVREGAGTIVKEERLTPLTTDSVAVGK